MKKHALTFGALLAPIFGVSAANAQTIVTPAPSSPPTTVVETPAPQQAPAPQQTVVMAAPARETAVSGGPNAMLLKSGLFVFGIPYGASIVVAAESNRDEDKNLYVPVVGPWMDFASRQDCGGFANASCSGETGIKVLLAADGILQAIGAIELVSAFLVPESRTVVAKDQGPRFMMGPSHVGRSGYGLAAVGTF
jgi:hypothetical protein